MRTALFTAALAISSATMTAMTNYIPFQKKLVLILLDSIPHTSQITHISPLTSSNPTSHATSKSPYSSYPTSSYPFLSSTTTKS